MWKKVKSITDLEGGDFVRHIRNETMHGIVTANFGDYAIAVATMHLSNASEWEVARKNEPESLDTCSDPMLSPMPSNLEAVGVELQNHNKMLMELVLLGQQNKASIQTIYRDMDASLQRVRADIENSAKQIKAIQSRLSRDWNKKRR